MKTETIRRPQGQVQNTTAKNETPDLSAELMRTIDRQTGDRVKCVRVYGDRYRVNWIAPEKVATRDRGMSIEAYYIRQSKFLRVTKTEDGLVIEDLTVDKISNN